VPGKEHQHIEVAGTLQRWEAGKEREGAVHVTRSLCGVVCHLSFLAQSFPGSAPPWSAHELRK
jgi:hypothetical protein